MAGPVLSTEPLPTTPAVDTMLANAEYGGAIGQIPVAVCLSPKSGLPPKHEAGTLPEARRGLAHALAIFLRRRQRQHAGLEKLKGGQISWAEESLGMLVADLAFVDEPFGWVCNALVALLDEPALRSPGANVPFDGTSGSWVTDAFSAAVSNTSSPIFLADCHPSSSDNGWVAEAFTTLVGSSAIESKVAQQQQQHIHLETHSTAYDQNEIRAISSGSWVAQAFEALVAGGIHRVEAFEVAIESSEQPLGWVAEAFSILVNGLRTRP